MTIDNRHIEAVNRLIEGRFGEARLEDVACGVGISDRTLRRWRDDPDFQALYDRMLGEFLQDIANQPMAQRVDRIRELYRLYCDLPDRTEHVTRGENRDGGGWESPRIQNNHTDKLKILKQIADEAEEGKVDQVGEVLGRLREELAELQGGPKLMVSDGEEEANA
ncbi:MAG: phBC6A51 family helix-turn-helix protein [Chloroflexi bacterium]|nr:phBC6A51 family helix-turn-helix protein [Chloroflexota bacterium]